MLLALLVSGKSKKEGRPIEAVPGAELRKLFGRGLFTEDSNCRIAGNQLDQNRDQRDYCPDNQDQQANPAQQSKQFVLHPLKVGNGFDLPSADDSRLAGSSISFTLLSCGKIPGNN